MGMPPPRDELEVQVGRAILIRTGPVRASCKATVALSLQLATGRSQSPVKARCRAASWSKLSASRQVRAIAGVSLDA